MTTLHLVDPAARELAAHAPVFDPERQTLEQFRVGITAAFAQMMPPSSSPGAERMIPNRDGAPDVRVLIYRPQDAAGGKLPAVLYIHGGGFFTGTAEVMDAFNRKLSDEHGAVVVAVGYRLAPETPFPGPVDDCYAALCWLFERADELGVDADRIIVLGHSAGGGLAAAVSLVARDRGEHKLRAQVLIYPMLDPRTGTDEAPIDNPTTGEFVWTRNSNRFGWNAMRGSNRIAPERMGHFAPALAEDLTNLPPTSIGVGSLDLFLEEDIAYALRLSRAGVPVEAHIYGGGIHGFDMVPGELEAQLGADLKAAVTRFLRD